MDPSPALVDTVYRSLLKPRPNPIEQWSQLERSWPHDVLVSAARTAMSCPVWELRGAGPIGIVTGSGGLRTRIPNISTAAALVAACADAVRVVKPGSFTSRTKVLGPCGLANRLGLRIPRNESELLQMLERDQFAVLDTEVMYPWIRLPEAFTVPFLCEALEQSSLQPCSAQWKVNGVLEADPVVHLVRCRDAIFQRTLVVYGRTDIPGFVIDDVSTAGTTVLLSIDEGTHRIWSVEPEEIGVARVRAADLVVAASLRAEDVLISILDGSAPQAWIDLVAVSAGAVLFQARTADDLSSGYVAARELLRSGAAISKLRRLQESR